MKFFILLAIVDLPDLKLNGGDVMLELVHLGVLRVHLSFKRLKSLKEA